MKHTMYTCDICNPTGIILGDGVCRIDGDWKHAEECGWHFQELKGHICQDCFEVIKRKNK